MIRGNNILDIPSEAGYTFLGVMGWLLLPCALFLVNFLIFGTEHKDLSRLDIFHGPLTHKTKAGVMSMAWIKLIAVGNTSDHGDPTVDSTWWGIGVQERFDFATHVRE
jgi:hypothetical protein